MILRVVRKETKNYNNSNDERCSEIDSVRKNGVTFGEILTKIKLLKKKKTKRGLIIKRYKKTENDFITSLSKIIIRKTLKNDENELVEDTYLLNEYLSDNKNISRVKSDEFMRWKKKHNNYFFPSLDAPWQVRKVFRVMEDNLGAFEKEQFLNLKFELWIYVNKPIALQDKILDIIYGENEHQNYNKLVMGDLINILKNLNSIGGYMRLIDFITEKREKMYRGERSYIIETDINILTSIKTELNRYVSKEVIANDIKRLVIQPSSMVKKYRLNNFIS